MKSRWGTRATACAVWSHGLDKMAVTTNKHDVTCRACIRTLIRQGRLPKEMADFCPTCGRPVAKEDGDGQARGTGTADAAG
jgi:rRNA maturation endonuclease Nob1